MKKLRRAGVKIKNIICSVVALQISSLLFIPFQAVGEQVQQVTIETRDTVSAVEQLSPEEKKWFAKFQEGNLFAEGWKKISGDILAKTPKELVEKQRVALEVLGIKIGCEWSKDNEIRKIDNDMLKQWGSLLKDTVGQSPHQITDVIAEIDLKVDMLLN